MEHRGASVEFAFPLTNLRTQLCVVISGLGSSVERPLVWPPAAEDFLKRIYKLGIHLTVIGPRPLHKFGTKKTVRFMDRHEVVSLKVLEASRSHRLELRVLNKKSRGWTRLRAEACLTIGPYGVWPQGFDGWTTNGTLSIQSLARWVGEQKWVPGREFVFVGSSNQSLRWATTLLDRGAKACHVLEQTPDLRCWRGYRDRFLAKGGKVLLNHKLLRVEKKENNSVELYLANEHGTRIIGADTIVLSSINDDAINAPVQWKKGLFYLQRRPLLWETRTDIEELSNETIHTPSVDEDQWFERTDWRELYWRIARFFEAIDQPQSDGALKLLREERRRMLAYRKPGVKRVELEYSGKILNRETMSMVQSSVSVPRTFAHVKPKASLECFENIPCRACVDVCPENAIEKIALTDLPKLLEDKCTGCGACVAICPAGVAVMVREKPVEQKANYFLPDNTKELWKPGRFVQLQNRRGDALGTGRVVNSISYQGGVHRVLEIESTNVHMWEARNFRIPRTDFGSEEPILANSPLLLKRGWVTLNGVKRLCPVGVPVTVALWQLGQRRFEDALFCEDSSCHLCEVNINGEPALACKALVREGQEISFTSVNASDSAKKIRNPLCPCRQVVAKDYAEMIVSGTSEELTRELTQLGQGTCHGRWCLASCELAQDEKLRPVFYGYEGSPWRDIWPNDVVDESDTPYSVRMATHSNELDES